MVAERARGPPDCCLSTLLLVGETNVRYVTRRKSEAQRQPRRAMSRRRRRVLESLPIATWNQTQVNFFDEMRNWAMSSNLAHARLPKLTFRK